MIRGTLPVDDKIRHVSLVVRKLNAVSEELNSKKSRVNQLIQQIERIEESRIRERIVELLDDDNDDNYHEDDDDGHLLLCDSLTTAQEEADLLSSLIDQKRDDDDTGTGASGSTGETRLWWRAEEGEEDQEQREQQLGHVIIPRSSIPPQNQQQQRRPHHHHGEEEVLDEALIRESIEKERIRIMEKLYTSRTKEVIHLNLIIGDLTSHMEMLLKEGQKNSCHQYDDDDNCTNASVMMDCDMDSNCNTSSSIGAHIIGTYIQVERQRHPNDQQQLKHQGSRGSPFKLKRRRMLTSGGGGKNYGSKKDCASSVHLEVIAEEEETETETDTSSSSYSYFSSIRSLNSTGDCDSWTTEKKESFSWAKNLLKCSFVCGSALF